MDCECVNSFVATLLAATYGSQTRCSMGERQRRRLSFARKLCLYCKHCAIISAHVTFLQIYESSYETRQNYEHFMFFFSMS